MSIFDALLIAIAAFVGPVLGATGARSLDEVLRRHSAIRVDRSVAAEGS